MSNIEENTKRCEQLIKPEHANWIGISNQLAIAHLIKRIKELEEENKLLLNGKVGVDLSYDDYIPRQKVEEKIEELKKHYNTDNNIRIYTLKNSYELQATILQELLEDK